jgi:hypothetical protein
VSHLVSRFGIRSGRAQGLSDLEAPSGRNILAQGKATDGSAALG